MIETYHIDPVRHVIYSVWKGCVVENDIASFACSLIREPEFLPQFDQIVDVRHVTDVSTRFEIARAARLYDPFASCSRWSFVVASEFQYRVLRMIIDVAAIDRQQGLFFDPREAHAWLGLEARARRIHAAA